MTLPQVAARRNLGVPLSAHAAWHLSARWLRTNVCSDWHTHTHTLGHQWYM